jgi:hypothetical protein
MVRDTKGDLLVLERCYDGTDGKTHEVVHVELCDFAPKTRWWQ